MTKTIDYITPMVFPEDPEWRKTLYKAMGWRYDELDSNDTVRYRSWGTEELLVQCVRKYMPWVRDIIILLATESQRQPWMDKYGVRVVYHKDFIPAKFLPTFNSGGIEMFLHRIQGLSERFLYGNDDMFPLSPLPETDFFRDGLPCQQYKEVPFPSKPNIFYLFCRKGLNFVARDFGKRYTSTWLKNGHAIAPILMDACCRLWMEHRKEIEASVTPFREPCNMNQYIYGWWQHFTGRYVSHTPPRRYLTVAKVGVEEMVQAVLEEDCGIVCLNDNEAVEDITPYAEAVREAIKRKLQ